MLKSLLAPAIVILVGIVLIVVSIVLDITTQVRDIVIVLAMLAFFAAGVAMIAFFSILTTLVAKLRDEVIGEQVTPILGTARDTATNIKGSTDFMTTRAAGPVIKIISFIAATDRFIRVVLGRSGG